MPSVSKSYAVTIRPKDGVTNAQIAKFAKWVTSRCEYSIIVTEKENTERHIHAALFLKKEAQCPTIRRSVVALFKELSETERIILGNGVKISYTPQWLDYCEKGDSTEIIHSNLPERSTLKQYYPVRDETKTRRHLSYYERLEKLWGEWVSPGTECNAEMCRNFLFDMMYNQRKIDVIRDDKTIIQVSRHLARFVNRADWSTLLIDPMENDK